MRAERAKDEREGRGVNGRVLVPFAAGAVVLVLLALHAWWTCDDAYIAFRYSRNLAEGLGLRFNLGVDPPVEGYTQLGWVLWFALLEKLPVDAIVVGHASEIAAGVGLVLAFVLAAQRRGHGALATGLGAIFLASSPTAVVWSTGGLGTMPFALLIFLVAERLWGNGGRPRWASGTALACLLAYWRFDAFYWLGLIFGFALLACWSREDGAVALDRTRLRRWLASVGVLGAAIGAQTAWRLAYHGDWLPNTARAKVGMSAQSLERGVDYLLTYWSTVPATLVLLVALVALALTTRRAWWIGSALLVLATFAYGVLTGGDFMAMGRFYLPALPFLALAASAMFQRLVARGRTPVTAISALALVGLSAPALFDLHAVPQSVREAVQFRWGRPYESEIVYKRGMAERAERWGRVGRALALHTDPSESLVRGSIGAVGYHSRMYIHDMFGLVNREVATGVEVQEMTMPGHDRIAPVDFFAPWEPTYRSARLVMGAERVERERAKQAALSPEERERHRVFEVSTADGFEEDGLLVLERF